MSAVRKKCEMLCPALHHTHTAQEREQETREGLNWRGTKIVTTNDLQGQMSILELPEGQGWWDWAKMGAENKSRRRQGASKTLWAEAETCKEQSCCHLDPATSAHQLAIHFTGCCLSQFSNDLETLGGSELVFTDLTKVSALNTQPQILGKTLKLKLWKGNNSFLCFFILISQSGVIFLDLFCLVSEIKYSAVFTKHMVFYVFIKHIVKYGLCGYKFKQLPTKITICVQVLAHQLPFQSPCNDLVYAGYLQNSCITQ